MTGLNADATESDDVEQPCPECGAAFGWNDEEDTFATIEGAESRIHRHGPTGELLVSVEFDCPECDEPLIIEDASGEAFETDPRPNR